MYEATARLAPPDRLPEPRPASGSALLRRLIADGALSSAEARRAASGLKRDGGRLRSHLVRTGLIPEDAYLEAAAAGFGAGTVDPLTSPPDPALLAAFGPARAAGTGCLPWQRAAGGVICLVSDAETPAAVEAELRKLFGRPFFAFARERDIEAALAAGAGPELARLAETRVPEPEACRDIARGPLPRCLAGLVVLLIAGGLVFPGATLVALTAWSVLTLLVLTAIRAAALAAHLRGPGVDDTPAAPAVRRPVVTLLVPLFRESEIADHLLRRLDRIEWPAALLDICLVVEDDDRQTRRLLARTSLPPTMRVIPVPQGTLRTKPRALNYALNFARGSIVGIYDAEDAPAPDQVARVVDRFHARPPEVVCLQGILDFYNARQNWLARLFTIDYASWFRVVLPGLCRLGLVIPLGGTSLFFRRGALEALGAWDAHNVTEDADLGIRLARHGYRAELIASVTGEEANCRVWPWIRQRTRWLKGYGVTWATHMRHPRRLWRDLGPWRFIGVQALFVATLSQFLLAPILWSFWLPVFGIAHPVSAAVPGPLLIFGAGLFLTTEVVTMAIAAAAVSGREKRWLIPWIPTLHLYWPLGTIACFRAAFEIAWRPFHWDKTAHGLSLHPGKDARRET